MEPTSERRLFDGRAVAYLFGKPDSWRTKDPTACSKMAEFALELGVGNIYAPLPSDFNAKIVSVEVLLCPGVYFSKVDGRGVTLHKGARADGLTDLPKGAAFWMASADCHIVVLSDGSRFVPVHAGRDSMIVPYWKPRFAGQEGRPSAIENAMKLFDDASRVEAEILLGIGPESFTHSLDDPTWSESNRRLQEEIKKRYRFSQEIFFCNLRGGSLSMPNLIMCELEKFGVDRERVRWDGVDTYADRKWWSCARGDSGRNGVFIVRH